MIRTDPLLLHKTGPMLPKGRKTAAAAAPAANADAPAASGAAGNRGTDIMTHAEFPPEHYGGYGRTAERGPENKETAYTGEQEYLNYLKSFLPGRDIVIADIGSNEEIRDYALANQGGFHIVISKEALERMMKDPDFEKKCLEALRSAREKQAGKLSRLPAQGKSLLGCGLVLGKDGEVAQWVLSQNQIRPEKKASNNSFVWKTKKEDDSFYRIKTEKGTLTVQKKKLSYVPARDLVKIARAANRQAVRRTISGIQAQIAQLKSGSGDRRVKAVLVKQAGQVLLKAKLKDKLLKREELLALQQKRAAQKADYEKSLQLKLLLKKKRENRKVREYGQIRDYYETPQERRLEEELKRCENGVASDTAVPAAPGSALVSAPAAPSAGGGAAGSAGVTLDITV